MSRRFAGRAFVKPRAAQFPDLTNGFHLAQAVGHALGDPPLDTKSFGELPGVERLRQRGRQQTAQIGGRSKLMRTVNFDEVLIVDKVIVVAPTPPTTMTRVAPFFNLNQHDFECQSLVGKHAREVDQLFEHIEQRAPLGAAAAGNDRTSLAAEFHEMLRNDERLHDHDIVLLLKQRGDLVANRSERRELDFDQLLAANDIDAVAANTLFDDAAIDGITFL